MSAERPSKDDIFNAAAELVDAAERQAYLSEVCRDDPQLRREIAELLERDREAGSFLESPPPGLSPTIGQTITETPGTQIGPYKLLQQIGEGGMGVVYMAEQKEPVKRRVAIKIIKPGMDTRQVIARFEAERQALAMMDHPNIASVLDAGQTDSGRPYFVMELINGLSVTKYCDEQHLTPKERLELFVPICQAIQHAHQKGIIHRDLKPSNILIALYDGQAVPKIIDFGVAKATSHTLTEKTMFTQLGQVVGTLEYMSPEQAVRNQLDIDTRSDIYSLGVVLYELLTGETPFDRERLRSAAFDEMLRIIREEEPSKPSTKVSSNRSLSSIAANRRIEPARLGSTIRGELDWIVMKALEKDRSRRYETASTFVADIQHYLNGEAVEACPPSASYRLRKFAHRHKTLVVTGAVIALILMTASIVSTSLAAWALKERSIARHERNEKERAKQNAEQAAQAAKLAQQVAQRSEADTQAFGDFLLEDVLAAARPKGVQGGLGVTVTVRQALDAAAARIGRRFENQPRAEAKTRQAMGITYLNLGKPAAGIEHLERALELYKQEFGLANIETLFTQSELARAYLRGGRRQESLRLHQQTLNLRRAALPIDHPQTLASINNVAWGFMSLDRFSDAIPLFEKALEKMKLRLGAEHDDTLSCMNSLAIAFVKSGQTSEAIPLLENLVRRREKKHGAVAAPTLNTKNLLAAAYHRAGRVKDAIPVFKEALEGARVLFVENDYRTLATMNNLAMAYHAVGDLKREEALLRELLDLRRTMTGPQSSRMTAKTLAALGNNLLAQKHYTAAKNSLLQCLEIWRAESPDNWAAFRAQSMLGGALTGQGKELSATDKSAAGKKYAEAETFLLAGYKGLKSRAAKLPDGGRRQLTEALKRLVAFYETRAAEGDGEHATQWKTELVEWQATPEAKND